jgi:hypothetical protein
MKLASLLLALLICNVCHCIIARSYHVVRRLQLSFHQSQMFTLGHCGPCHHADGRASSPTPRTNSVSSRLCIKFDGVAASHRPASAAASTSARHRHGVPVRASARETSMSRAITVDGAYIRDCVLDYMVHDLVLRCGGRVDRKQQPTCAGPARYTHTSCYDG